MADLDYRDKETLEFLYYEMGLNQQEIADRFDVVIQTISRYMVEHGINPGREQSQFSRVERANFLTDDRGYERWDARDLESGGMEYVKVHRLLAVAKYGFDAVADNDVHHKNHIPWDNRPSNVEVVDRHEHISDHAKHRIETGNYVRRPDGSFGSKYSVL